MSASKMRKAAVEGDFETFSKGSLKDCPRKIRGIILTLRTSMQVEESMKILLKHPIDLYEIAPKVRNKVYAKHILRRSV